MYIHVRQTCTSLTMPAPFNSRLLDVLADRKAKAGLSGHVLVNGNPQPSNFKCSTGYVVQVCVIDSLLFGSLHNVLPLGGPFH